jgi:hypothetical protein
MKLNLFQLGQTNQDLQAELPAFFDAWEKEIESAKPVFELEGVRLELIARNIPHHQVFYAQRAMEARAVVKWLEVQKAKAESRYVKNYNNSPRALGVKEQSQYLQGEKEVVELNQLIIQAALYQQQFDEIVEAVKQLGWMVGNITKLRVAELQDAVI